MKNWPELWKDQSLAESSTTTAPQPAHSFQLLEDGLAAGRQIKERFGVGSSAELRALDELRRQHARIAELEAELARVTAELKAFQDAKALAELQAKQARAKAFAEKQGLDVADEAVANAIAQVNYEMIAELAMQMTENAEANAPAPVVEVSMASFVDMDISDEEYGGLLKRPAHK